MIFYLACSIIVINLIHSYLLITHRSNHDLTISERAAKNNVALGLYALGHFVGGLAFGIFAWLLFVTTLNVPVLFYVTLTGIACEWAQALIPARRKFERYHLFLAYSMSVIMTALGILSAVLLAIDDNLKRSLFIIAGLILCGYPLAILLPKRYFWVIEMVNINLFYLQMILILLYF